MPAHRARCTTRTQDGTADGSPLVPPRRRARLGESASEAACKPSSVPLRTATTVIHLGRRSPDGSCSRPEGWAARLSPANRGCALLFGLAPGRVCRVSLRPRQPASASSLWHWSSPLGGRELPATLRCGARTFLTPTGCPPSARPSGRLAGRRILATAWYPDRRPDDRRRGYARRPSRPGRSARGHPVEGLVGQPVGRASSGPAARGPPTSAGSRRSIDFASAHSGCTWRP